MNASRVLQSSALVLTVVAASISACSSDPASNGSPASGGTTGKATGGGSSGGASATGGKASTGGSSSGGTTTGGSKAIGGSSSGGTAAGGAVSGGTSSSGAGGAVSGSGGAVGAAMIGTGACSLPDAAASAMGKTCADYCEAWLMPPKSCHDMDGYTNVYIDDNDGSDCHQKCSMFSESQFCCRMEHVALSLVELAKIPQADIDNPKLKNFPTVTLHCGHAAGQTLCQ